MKLNYEEFRILHSALFAGVVENQITDAENKAMCDKLKAAYPDFHRRMRGRSTSKEVAKELNELADTLTKTNRKKLRHVADCVTVGANSESVLTNFFNLPLEVSSKCSLNIKTFVSDLILNIY